MDAWEAKGLVIKDVIPAEAGIQVGKRGAREVGNQGIRNLEGAWICQTLGAF